MIEKIENHTIAPEHLATDFLLIIADAESALSKSKNTSQDIENRSFFSSVFSSTRKDVLKITDSQHSFNDLLLKLFNKMFEINVLSFMFLTKVVEEIDKQATSGIVDANGKITHLGKEGKELAKISKQMFERIMIGSRDTKEKIEKNENNIKNLMLSLKKKDKIDIQQTADIEEVKVRLVEKDQLDKKQSYELDKLETRLKEKDSVDNTQTQEIGNIIDNVNNLITEFVNFKNKFNFTFKIIKYALWALFIFNIGLGVFIVFKMNQ